jgi:tRNA(Ile)-lysidine synthetase-like protein
MESLQAFYPIVWSCSEKESVQLLQNIREFWSSNKDFWFSHAPIDSWPIQSVPYTDTKDTNVSLILHYDQIFRHPNPHIRASDKTFAFRFATALVLRMIHSGQFEEVEEWEQVFLLLCLRHNKSLGLKELALKKLTNLIEVRGSTPLLLRFLQATVLDIHSFKQETQGYPDVSCDFKESEDSETEKRIQSILQSPVMSEGYTSTKTYDILYKAFKNVTSGIKEERIAVSISGGVDSMVAAYIAKDVCAHTNRSLILLHIAYNNRDCCPDEIALLRRFSKRLSVPLYVLDITELKRCRNSDMRSLYEDVTRQMRFSFYRYFGCPVILGHNLDDCFENVFQNLSKQIHSENLFGMSAISREQGVTIVRPMLEIAKKEIVLFADHSNIPHLYDSTPAWSRRGQMRDSLLPGIQSFDPAILPGLAQFARYTSFLEQQWSNSFHTWIQSVFVRADTVQIPRDTFFSTNYHMLNFWNRVWNHLKLSARPSNKSFHNLIGMIERGVASQCVLSSRYTVSMDQHFITLLCKPMQNH